MNEFEHLLTVLTEECAEVAQRACKVARFGLTEIQPGQGDNNKRRLERELADLLATAELLGLTIRDEDKAAKIEKLKKFMNYSREIGTLSEMPKQEKGVFCLDHRKVMVDGICPKCSEKRKDEVVTLSGCGHTFKAKDVLCPICGV